MIEDGDRTKKEYWDKRIRENKGKEDDLSLVYASGEARLNQEITKRVLQGFADCSVVDVGCGFGRFAPIFDSEKYYGFDFSDEMIKMANEKHPSYKFAVADMNDHDIPEAEIVFQAISLGMFQIQPQDFFEKYKHKAKKAVISIDGTNVIIYPKYDRYN